MSTPLVPARRAAWIAVAVGLATLVALGLRVHGSNHGLAVDDAVNRWIHAHFDVYDRYHMVQTTDVRIVVAATVLIAGAAVAARRVDLAAVAVAAPIVAIVGTEYVFKPLVDRTNPVVLNLTGSEMRAYPSGHETGISTVLVLLAVLVLRWHGRVWVKVAALVALTGYLVITVLGLVGQYYHYFTDTVGAFGWSVAVVLGLALASDAVLARRRVRV